MKKIKKLIAPAALSLLLALGLAISVPGFVSSVTKTERNMTIEYTAEGTKNGPYNITLSIMQANKPEFQPFAPTETLTGSQLCGIINDGEIPVYYNKNGSQVRLRCLKLGGKNIFRAGQSTVGNLQGYSNTDIVDWATPENLSLITNGATEAIADTTLTVTFKDDFDFTDLTPTISADGVTSSWDDSTRVLTVTGYDYSANVGNPLIITFSNVPLFDKEKYSTNTDIDTLDLDGSKLKVEDSGYMPKTVALPQDTVPVGPEYTYTLNYDANGGENAPASQSEGPIPDEIKDFVIAETVPTRDNYTFQGWAEGADAPDTIYRPGDTITLESSSPEKTLYALWEENEITITYQASEGGSVSLEGETIKIVTGQPEGSTATPNEGYYFVNWTDEEGVVVSTDPHFIPTENREATYTANFAPIKEEITPEKAIETLQPTTPSTGHKSTTTDGVNASVLSSILGLFIFGLILAAIARIKR